MSSCFNRTFMELKFKYFRNNDNPRISFQSYLYGIEIWWRNDADHHHNSFNRTFMELKSNCGTLYCCTRACFNRTFMELKYGRVISAIILHALFQSYLYGIEIPVSILSLLILQVFQSYLYGIEIAKAAVLSV